MTSDRLKEDRAMITTAIRHIASALVLPGMNVKLVFPEDQPTEETFLFTTTYAEQEHTFIVMASLPITCKFGSMVVVVKKCVQTLFRMRMNLALKVLRAG